MIPVGRWTARILSTAVLLLVVVFAFGEGLPPIWKQPTSVQIDFFGMALMMAGSVVGWKRDGLAGILLVAGYAAFPIVELGVHNRIALLHGRFSPLDFNLVAGILFCACWWLDKRRRGVISEKDFMEHQPITDKDRRMAQRCLECPACKHASRKQRGILFWFVKTIEDSVCPYCKAYERVYGRKAHEPREPQQGRE